MTKITGKRQKPRKQMLATPQLKRYGKVTRHFLGYLTELHTQVPHTRQQREESTRARVLGWLNVICITPRRPGSSIGKVAEGACCILPI